MKCPICKTGKLSAVQTRLELPSVEGTPIVFEDVAAERCQKCGEEFISDSTMARILEVEDLAANTEMILRAKRLVVRSEKKILAK